MRFALQVLLFAPIVFGYWFVHGSLASWVQWVPDLFAGRTLRLAGLLLGVVLCGVLSGLLFAAPMKLLYRQRALLVALVVSVGAGAFDVFHMQLKGALPFTQVALILDLVVFILALPAAVIVFGRFRPGRSSKPNPLRGSV